MTKKEVITWIALTRKMLRSISEEDTTLNETNSVTIKVLTKLIMRLGEVVCPQYVT